MPLANTTKITKKSVYEKEELPPLNKDELKREIVRLHVEEQVPRGEILKQIGVGTQHYPILRKALREYMAQNPTFQSPTRKRRKHEQTP